MEQTQNHPVEKRKVNCVITVQNILLDIVHAIPCALIINELISNALKHAFVDIVEPELFIGFEKADGFYTLTVRDNGIGLPEGFESAASNTMGLFLVRALTKQLRGTLQLLSDPSVRQGTSVVISFEIIQKKRNGQSFCA